MARKPLKKTPAAPADTIEVVGARTHNLRDISCHIRRGKMTVVTGVSGSGKSSLAFDTLYAEGQRRYVASMSTYARQFLEQMQRPDVDAIYNIPPAIALEQKNTVTNARSTIGTATEVNDFLRLLFARVGHVYCEECDEEVHSDTPSSAAATLGKLPEGRRLIILAPVRLVAPDAEALKAALADMQSQGFTRAMDEDGQMVRLDDFEYSHLRQETGEGDWAFVELIADRIAVKPKTLARLAEALELAFTAGNGRARVRDVDSGAEWHFTSLLACNSCGREFKKPEPALFSFSSPLGACPTCQGFGRVMGIDYDKVIPNWDMTLVEQPIVPWNSPSNSECYTDLLERAPEIPWDVPLSKFTERQKRILIKGNRAEMRKEGDWYGIEGFFRWLEGRRYKIQARVMLARYRAYDQCPDCHGARLVPDALAVRIGGRTIAEVTQQSIGELHEYFDLLRFPPHEEQAAKRLLSEIRSRLHYLDNVGLGYLTLSRQTRTLSGGESQRINLATALGSALTETLYVLDEPTVGLHSRDTFRLLEILQSLRERGNTVVVVEHDPDIILGADDVIDIGPAAGELGGELLYCGPLEGIAQSHDSITAKYLTRAIHEANPSRGRRPHGWIEIKGARENNLKNLSVRIPRGVFCCVTGVSGSGKSTLVNSILYAGFKRLRENAPSAAGFNVGAFDKLVGIDALTDMLLVDQRPIGRSSRSNPVTYVKAYDEIRKLLASTREAKHGGIRAGNFSFNVDGGRCESCKGTGLVTIDMHFLADVEVVCDACDGKRFMRNVLNIEWHGKNIDDMLDLTVLEALEFFADEAKVVHGLLPLQLVGLAYLRLGQSTATLSGGEAQRLKLAGFLAANKSVLRRVLFGLQTDGNADVTHDPSAPEYMMIFDEPTTGLHAADLDLLANLLHNLVDCGVSVLVVEHNLDLIAHADWIIDLGPEGGDGGGEVVAQGKPKEIIASPRSHTGKYLAARAGGTA